MRLLLAHVFLWWNEGSPRLSRKVSKRFGRGTVGEYIQTRIAHYGMEPLPITLAHVLASGSLPRYHRDPFDRMLIAQGQVEQLVIVTHDAQLRSYAAQTVW